MQWCVNQLLQHSELHRLGCQLYVLARQHNGKTVLTILNGKKADNQVDVARYAEVIGSHTTATDVLTGATVDLTKNIPLTQRQAMVLSF